MTTEERKACKATIPAFDAFDGETYISARAGDMMWRLVDNDPDQAEFFNLDAVSLSEHLELIRHLIGAYNWRVLEANKEAASGLPALGLCRIP
jgi:hypothetical protein